MCFKIVDFDQTRMWKQMPPGMDIPPVCVDVRERLRQKLADRAKAAAGKAKSDVDEASASYVFIKTKF